MKLLSEVKSIQEAGKMTDGEMAELLGVHRVTWVNVRNGKIPMSASFQLKVINVFPQLQGIFLSENTTPRIAKE